MGTLYYLNISYSYNCLHLLTVTGNGWQSMIHGRRVDRLYNPPSTRTNQIFICFLSKWHPTMPVSKELQAIIEAVPAHFADPVADYISEKTSIE